MFRSAIEHKSKSPHYAYEPRAVRLVVLDFSQRFLSSTIDVYGAVGPGWIMGPEYDYPVYFQEQVGKYKIDRLRDEIEDLGGTFFLKPDLEERELGNPLYWSQAGVAVPVANGAEDADEVASIINSISLAIEQSGLFAQGSVSGIRNPRQSVETVTRDPKSKPQSRPKWRGSWRGGELIPSNSYG